MIRLMLALMLSIATTPAMAVNPDEVLENQVLEARARAISQNLRCLVCQNQSIDESDADLARDLRILVRERLMAGDSDDEVLSFVVARYGDYVLLKPPFKLLTLILWFGPLALFGIAAFAGFRFLKRNSEEFKQETELTKAERIHLKNMQNES